jgi:threonylcarbamoyladenosine tRNA methylthiotransferase MtaB
LPATPPVPSQTQIESVRAVLRIQDGCDEHCTFCATTLARGRNRSRGIEDVVREAERLAAWHPEIVLTGTHIGTWGADIDSSLGLLVESLVSRVPDVRFRLSSIEATEVDDRLAELLVAAPGRVAPHLHAPLQSGADGVLRRMGRHWYTARTYAAAIERIASRAAVFGLGADIIAGFPGETDADFEATVRLVESLPFTYLHVFPYSARPGTAAPRLPGALPSTAIRERARRLREIGDAKARAYAASRAGGAADTIVVTAPPRRDGVTADYLTLPVRGERGRGSRFTGMLAWGTESLEVV